MTNNNHKSKSWLEISKTALLSNIKAITSLLPKDVSIMAVIKANAYGHGLKQVSSLLNRTDIEWFGVDSLEEALLISKQRTDLPILIMGYTLRKDLVSVIENSFRQVVYDIETLKVIESEAKGLNKKAYVHLKIETGTNRQGIKLEDLETFADFFVGNSYIVLEGIYTHFADVESGDGGFAAKQLAEYKKSVDIFAKRNITIPLHHAAATSAILLLPETHFNLVRLGIGLYGLWPSREIKEKSVGADKKIGFMPVLQWKTIVAQIKMVKSGESVGYGQSECVRRDSTIAVIPQGYADGYDRKLSSCGEVLIRGERVKVLGRICMNIFMVDITDIGGVQVEDEVVLIGTQGEEEITAEELADKCDTINYEIVSRINPLIVRTII